MNLLVILVRMFQGKETAVFRGNRILVVLFVIGAVGFAPLTLLLWQRGGTWLTALIGLIVVGLVAAAVSLLFLRVRIFADGIAVISLSGENEMRWDQVESLYFEAFQQREYGIPIMTSYTLRLADASGNILKVPAGLARARVLANLIVSKITPLITDRLVPRFNSGERLAFGSMQISLPEGIQAKANAFNTVITPWSMFAGVRIKMGMLSILRRDGKNGGVAAISRTPNAFVLQKLLAQMVKTQTKSIPTDELVKAAKFSL